MYDKLLESFITIADCGSFTRAADLMFVSSTALVKQINQLEASLGVKLFVRSNKGIRLSEAGKLLYKDSKYIINYSRQAVDRAVRALRGDPYIVRIGVSPMDPVDMIERLLESIAFNEPHFRFDICPFPGYYADYAGVINSLGEHIDVVVGAYGFSHTKKPFYQALPLASVPMRAAVPKKHRLAANTCVELEDLRGETVLISSSDIAGMTAPMAADLERHQARVEYLKQTSFDITAYNQCAYTGTILISPVRNNVHPLLKSIPINWSYTVPYGLIYPSHPNEGVEKFIRAAAEYIGVPLDAADT